MCRCDYGKRSTVAVRHREKSIQESPQDNEAVASGHDPDGRRGVGVGVGRVVGRFAPSPSGALHAGSLAAAMASWLDVRARGGRWLLRIEDVDRPREVAGAADDIVETLAALGFRWDGAIVRQRDRDDLYLQAFDRLRDAGALYPCGCTRREIEQAVESDPHAAVVYPGTCRGGLAASRSARAWRLRVPDRDIAVDDRAAGVFRQNLAREVGDFVVKRADGLWAYQLAAVVDDAEQGVTDVVRGADLLDSTPRQRLLQELLGLPQPRTLHVPLVLDEAGRKLNKSSGGPAIARSRPLEALRGAAAHLGLSVPSTTTVEAFWTHATTAWAARWPVADARGD